MSYVNKVSKSNVEYDIQDARTFVLDLGDITSLIDDGTFQKSIAYADLVSLVNAEVGIVKFLMSGTEAVCRVFGKSGSAGSGYTAMASFFMQSQSNEYTTFIVQCMGSGETASVSGTMIQQTIGGGSGGSVPMFSAQLSDWQSNEGVEIAEFSVSSEDYDIIANNDVAFIKLLDYNNSDIYVLPKTLRTDGDGGSDMYIASAFGLEGDVLMAMVIREDDGDGGYVYTGMCMLGDLSSLVSTLKFYRHNVSIDLGGNEYEHIMFTNTDDSSVDSYNSLISALGNDSTFAIKYADHHNDVADGLGRTWNSNAVDGIIYSTDGTTMAKLGLAQYSSKTISDSVSELQN